MGALFPKGDVALALGPALMIVYVIVGAIGPAGLRGTLPKGLEIFRTFRYIYTLLLFPTQVMLFQLLPSPLFVSAPSSRVARRFAFRSCPIWEMRGQLLALDRSNFLAPC